VNRKLTITTTLLLISTSAEAHGQDAILWFFGILIGLIVVGIISITYLKGWKKKLLPVVLSIPIPLFIGMLPSSYLKILDEYYFTVGFWPTFVSGVGAVLIIHNLTSLKTNIVVFTLVTLPFVASMLGIIVSIFSENLANTMNLKFETINVGNTKKEIYSLLGIPDFEASCNISSYSENGQSTRESLLSQAQKNKTKCFSEAHYLNRLANREWVISFSRENYVLSKDIYLPY